MARPQLGGNQPSPQQTATTGAENIFNLDTPEKRKGAGFGMFGMAIFYLLAYYEMTSGTWITTTIYLITSAVLIYSGARFIRISKDSSATADDKLIKWALPLNFGLLLFSAIYGLTYELNPARLAFIVTIPLTLMVTFMLEHKFVLKIAIGLLFLVLLIAPIKLYTVNMTKKAAKYAWSGDWMPGCKTCNEFLASYDDTEFVALAEWKQARLPWINSAKRGLISPSSLKSRKMECHKTLQTDICQFNEEHVAPKLDAAKDLAKKAKTTADTIVSKAGKVASKTGEIITKTGAVAGEVISKTGDMIDSTKQSYKDRKKHGEEWRKQKEVRKKIEEEVDKELTDRMRRRN